MTLAVRSTTKSYTINSGFVLNLLRWQMWRVRFTGENIKDGSCNPSQENADVIDAETASPSERLQNGGTSPLST